jgi:hypothetical protein
MRDYPWFKIFTAEALLETSGMSDEDVGRWFRGAIRAWLTDNYAGYEWLERQADATGELRKIKSHAGHLGGQARAKHNQARAKQNVAKLSTVSILSSISSEEECEEKQTKAPKRGTVPIDGTLPEYLLRVKEWCVAQPEEWWDEQTKDFPDVDFQTETDKAREWLKTNETRRSNLLRFFRNWYSKAQHPRERQ